MIKIPLKNVPSQKLRIVLGNQNVTLRIFYRFENIYADVYVGSRAVALGSICRNRTAIVENAGSRFSGNLFFLDMLGDSDPSYKEFGSRYVLMYVPASEPVPAGFVG